MKLLKSVETNKIIQKTVNLVKFRISFLINVWQFETRLKQNQFLYFLLKMGPPPYHFFDGPGKRYLDLNPRFTSRSSCLQMFFKIGVLNNNSQEYSILTGKHLCSSLFIIKKLLYYKKETPTQVFSGEICEIFYRSPQVAAPIHPPIFS